MSSDSKDTKPAPVKPEKGSTAAVPAITNTTSSTRREPIEDSEIDLHSECTEFHEFFTIKALTHIPDSDEKVFTSLVEVRMNQLSHARAFRPGTHYIPATQMMSGYADSSGAQYSNLLSTLFLIKSGKEVTAMGLPPILPKMFGSITIWGKFSYGQQIHVHAYAINNEHMDEQGHVATVSFHQLKVLCHHIFRTLVPKVAGRKKGAADIVTDNALLEKIAAALFADKTERAEFCDNMDAYNTHPTYAPIKVDVMGVVEYMAYNPEIAEMFWRNPHTKMLFHTNEWNTLSRYYPAEIIGNGMSQDMFLFLYQILVQNPLALCFTGLPKVKVGGGADATNTNVNNAKTRWDDLRVGSSLQFDLMVTQDEEEIFFKRQLPELSGAHIMDIINRHATAHEPDVFVMAMLTLYEAMKASFENNKHSFINIYDLRLGAVSYANKLIAWDYKDAEGLIALVSLPINSDSWAKLLGAMEAKHIIKTHRKKPESPLNIYLYSQWAYEYMIGLGCKQIVSNFERCNEEQQSVIAKKLPDLTKLKTNAGHLLCSEQLEALKCFINSPIMIVDGRPGSGKSDFLQSLMMVLDRNREKERAMNLIMLRVLFPKQTQKQREKMADAITDAMVSPEVMATSAQGNNVSDLNRALGAGMAYTMHSAFLRHHMHCPNFGFRSIGKTSTGADIDGGGDGGKVCIFENIKVWIVEEASLATPETFSKLLGLLSVCAKNLQRLVLVGDQNQCASVSGGNVLIDFGKALMRSKKVMNFTHDHRTIGGFNGTKHSPLNQNATRMLYGGTFAELKFTDPSTVHIPIPPQFGGKCKLDRTALEKIFHEIVQRYNMTPFRSHMVTRLNEYCRLLGQICSEYYFTLLHPSFTYKPREIAYRGSKIVFNQKGASGTKSNAGGLPLVSNRIYIVVSIFDMNTNMLSEMSANGSVQSYLKKRKRDKLEEQQDRNGNEDWIPNQQYQPPPPPPPKKEETTKTEAGTETPEHEEEEEDKKDSDKVIPGEKLIKEVIFAEEPVTLTAVATHCNRYLVLYELSTFSNKIMDDARYTRWPYLSRTASADWLEARVEHERRRFLNQIQSGSAPNVIRASYEAAANGQGPTVIDTEEVFSVYQKRFDMAQNCSSAFVTTVHKTQGSQFQQIAFWLLTGSPFDTRQVMYTAYTRAREQAILIGAPQNIQESMNTPEPVRNTSLAERIVTSLQEFANSTKK